MIVTRFAPSPTGYLHLGHAFAAITASETAEQEQGRFLLRMEDIDRGRWRVQFELAICEDLRWLGLDWDQPIVRQSERFEAYQEALSALAANDLLYPCFCTRGEIAAEIARSADAPHGPGGANYPGTCRSVSPSERSSRIKLGEPHAIRLDVRKAAARAGPLHFNECGSGPNGERGTIIVDPLFFGDVVLARKDTPASYHLAVVVDDAFQQVTLVTRGNDLFEATHIQRLLQSLLNLTPPEYAHHPLVLDQDGRKFSKRDNAATLRAMRRDGITPKQVRDRLALIRSGVATPPQNR